ncbi:uncharacterized protein B0H18DRAFT_108484 [Fomitopsis serialis]|uniref:uncharacterized protein n=1 Tax=Fomitopsis serialis TaxID=139415 RepID=UPI002007543E|nr:uncharacterized protein B0H18DRAFT_108484 [Neoantrodia serialis]KAH9915118.1 hypothetical protein B0H18DRAFT_108484 [Neoantrodia serialis]
MYHRSNTPMKGFKDVYTRCKIVGRMSTLDTVSSVSYIVNRPPQHPLQIPDQGPIPVILMRMVGAQLLFCSEVILFIKSSIYSESISRTYPRRRHIDVHRPITREIALLRHLQQIIFMTYSELLQQDVGLSNTETHPPNPPPYRHERQPKRCLQNSGQTSQTDELPDIREGPQHLLRGAVFRSRGRERGQGDGRATTEPELLCPQDLFY